MPPELGGQLGSLVEKSHLRYQSTPPVLDLLHANPLAHDEWAAGGLCARYSACYVALNYFIPLWDKLGTGFWVRHAENISTSLVVFDCRTTGRNRQSPRADSLKGQQMGEKDPHRDNHH
jgi:hypothetical protein